MSLTTSIFLIICAFLLGIAVGGFIGSLRQEKKADGRAVEPLPDEQEAVLAPQAAAGLAAALPVPASQPPAVQLPDPSPVPGAGVVEIQPTGDTKKRKRIGFVNMIANALATDVSNTRLPDKSIAVQVNEILQEKLKDTPLEERGICLIELPGQDMVVMIGLDKYASVSAVPDDEIRAVIQSAVNDWLKKSA